MTQKCILLILSAVLWCSAQGSRITASYNQEALQARKDLTEALIVDFTEFMIDTLLHDKPTIENVFNDASIKHNTALRFENMFMFKTLKNIERYKAQRKSTYVAVYPLLVNFDYSDLLKFIIKYNTSPPQGRIESNVQLFRTVLQKNHVQDGDLLQDLLKRFSDTTTPKLLKTFNDYVLALSQNQKQTQADVIAFYREFQNEQNEFLKYNMFEQFLSKSYDDYNNNIATQ